MRAICLSLVILLTLPLNLRAAVEADLSKINDKAFTVALTPEAFKIISAELKKRVFKNIINMPMADIHTTAQGVKVHVSRISLTLYFHSVNVWSVNQGVHAKIGVRYVALNLGKIKMTKRVIGQTIKSFCYGAGIRLAENYPLYLNTDFVSQVSNYKVKFSPKNTSFGVPENNYRVKSPDRCTGPLGTGELVKLIVKDVLKKQRSRVESEVRKKVGQSVPDLEGQFNKALTQNFHIDLRDFPLLPGDRVKVAIKPSQINSNRNLFRLTFAADMQFRDSLVPLKLGTKHHEVLTPLKGPLVAQFGFNPTVVTEFLRKLYPAGLPFVELHEGIAPQFEIMLSKKFLSTIFPDLETLNTLPKLRGFIAFPKIPLLKVDGATDSVHMDFQHIHLKFMAYVNDVWIDYFHLKIKFKTAIQYDFIDGTILAIGLSRDSFVDIAGYWDENYTPEDPWFDAEVLYALFEGFFEPIYLDDHILKIELPTITFGGYKFKLSRPYISEPYWGFEVRRK